MSCISPAHVEQAQSGNDVFVACIGRGDRIRKKTC